MDISQKIKLIRQTEQITQQQLSEIVELSISTLKKIEAGYNEPTFSTLSKLTSHPKFQKYALWLISDITAPEAGQISPTLSPDGAEKDQSHHSERKIG
ncbi:helix-turn-helix domain-containing protein [Morganella morganii]|uniref:helix-turn-helix domain-containing protein n=1 Tax=Morganella morganii TaxID=582 RepID=UPI00339BF56F